MERRRLCWRTATTLSSFSATAIATLRIQEAHAEVEAQLNGLEAETLRLGPGEPLQICSNLRMTQIHITRSAYHIIPLHLRCFVVLVGGLTQLSLV